MNLLQDIYDTYPIAVIVGICALIVITILIAALLVYVVRFRQSIREEMMSSMINDTLFRSLPVDLMLVNRNADIFLYKTKDLQGKENLRNICELVPEKTCDLFRDMIEDVLNSKSETRELEYQNNGCWKHAVASKVKTRFFYEKNLVLILSIDIDAMKQSQEKLKNIAEERSVIFESIGDGLIVTDKQQRITLFNPEAARLTGYSVSEALGRPLRDIYHILDSHTLAATESSVARCLASDKKIPGQQRFVLLSKDEKRYHITDTASLIHGVNPSDITGSVLVFHDITDLCNKQNELIKNSSLIKYASEIAHISYFEEDAAGRITYLTESSHWPYRDGVPIPPEEWLCPDDLPIFQNYWRQLHSGEISGFSLQYKAGDPENYQYFMMHVSSHVDLTDSGKGYLGIIQDLSEIYRIQKKYEELNLFLESILEHLPAMVYIKDAANDYRVIKCNRNYCEYLAKKRDEVIGKNALELFPMPNGMDFYRDDQTVTVSNPLLNRITTHALNGLERTVQTSKELLMTEEGKGFLVCVGMDITDQEHQRQKLAETSAMLKTLLDNIPAVVMVKSPNDGNRYISWNHQAEHDFGLAASEVIGKKSNEIALFKSVFHEFDREDENLSQEQNSIRRIRNLDTPNGLRTYDISKQYVKINEEHALIVSLGVEITSIVQAEKKLRLALSEAQAAERAKSSFLATMSHELRTPLNAVIGFSELLQNASLPEEEQNEAIQSIYLAGNTLLELINDILDLSKLEAEKMVILPEYLDMNVFLTGIEKIYAQTARNKNLTLNMVFRNHLPILNFDPKRLRQVIVNILGNAFKFTREGGITITASFEPSDESKGVLMICIQDTGIGMTEENISQLFEPFRQFHRGDYGGTGLGLAISWHLIRKMGGKINVTSSPGHGSTFTIQIPDMEFKRHSVASNQNLPVKKQELRKQYLPANAPLLLVDDVEMNLKVLGAMMKQLDIPFVACKTASEVFAYIKKNPVIGVFTDMWMPEMNGNELAEELRKNPATATIPVVAITADIQLPQEYRHLFAAILYKPVTLQKLRSALDVLRKSES